jgi:hypothetical protein
MEGDGGGEAYTELCCDNFAQLVHGAAVTIDRKSIGFGEFAMEME